MALGTAALETLMAVGSAAAAGPAGYGAATLAGNAFGALSETDAQRSYATALKLMDEDPQKLGATPEQRARTLERLRQATRR